jgi:hypothetical protein
MRKPNDELSEAIYDGCAKIANAVTPLGASPARDEDGGYVASLTEAIMSIGSALRHIALAIGDLAEAIREKKGE